jgi:hypothetical protein
MSFSTGWIRRARHTRGYKHITGSGYDRRDAFITRGLRCLFHFLVMSLEPSCHGSSGHILSVFERESLLVRKRKIWNSCNFSFNNICLLFQILYLFLSQAKIPNTTRTPLTGMEKKSWSCLIINCSLPWARPTYLFFILSGGV